MPQTAQTTPERLTVTVEEAARLLGVSRQSAYQAARCGELPTIQIGRRLLVSKIALERMLGLNDERPAVATAGARETTSGATDAGYVGQV
jgi:excisionase family DNA binding protein